ncbi:MAG: hypothetical protein LBU91_07570 [Bacteroidales bacterium]|nr:hypothetical protein [Bacteroidales bacterium]
MKKLFTSNFFMVTALIVIAAVARVFTPIPNFTPVAAIALFGGAYFANKYAAFLIPIAIMALTDVWIGAYDVISMSAVYLSFALTCVIGLMISGKVKVGRVALGAVASSLLFFLITNFGVWMSGFCGYPMTLGGLTLCYEMALPFFRNELLGTLVYSGVLFGAFELAKKRFPALAH